MSQNSDKKLQNATKNLRNQEVLAMASSGLKTEEIADAVGVSRATVSRVLNSTDAKELVKYGQERLKGMVDLALGTVEDVMKDRPVSSTALTAALAVLKNLGIHQDKIDISHQFPQPTIIEKMDGSKVILGVEKE